MCCEKNLDKPAQNEPDLLTQHRCWTSHMLLNGSRSLRKVFPEEWKLLNYHGFGMRCNVQVSSYFWPFNVRVGKLPEDFGLTGLSSFPNWVQFSYSECDNKTWRETAEHQVYNNWFKSWVNSRWWNFTASTLKNGLPIYHGWNWFSKLLFFPQTNTLRVSHSVSHLAVRQWAINHGGTDSSINRRAAYLLVSARRW